MGGVLYLKIVKNALHVHRFCACTVRNLQRRRIKRRRILEDNGLVFAMAEIFYKTAPFQLLKL